MGSHLSRSRYGEPALDLATGLGRLTVSSAQLRHLLGALTSSQADVWTPGDTLRGWTEHTLRLLELHDRILAAAAVMRFTGSAGEHLTIDGQDGVRIPADAAYVTTLSRRMDRHVRLGRLMLGAEPAAPAEALQSEAVAV